MFARLKRFLSEPGTGFRAPARIFWVAFAIRVLYITLAHTYRVRVLLDHFQFGWEVGRIARALATGQGFANPFLGPSGPTTWIPPLYPLILAGVFKLFGVYTARSAWVILTINSVFSASTALAVYEIAARCYDSASGSSPQDTVGPRTDPRYRTEPRHRSDPRYRTALWSAWLWALYPAAIQFAVHWIWDMSLSTCLFTWTLVLALRVRAIGEALDAPAAQTTNQTTNQTASQTTSRWALFGLLWGLIALSNPSLLIFVPVCGLWMLWGARATLPGLTLTFAKGLLAAAIVSACLAPWIARNWLVFHAFIPTRGNLGAELYQSTLEENNGFPWGPTLPLAETHPEFLKYKRMGELAYVREKDVAARANIRRHPHRIFDWTLKRVYFFWASVPHPFEQHPSIEVIREMNFGFLSVSGILGLVLSLRRRIPASWLFASAFVVLPLVYYTITVQARFRHPIEPLIAIFTVYLFRSADRTRPFSWSQPRLISEGDSA